jgi:hypothetical protein
VTSIGEDAFWGCTGLQSINVDASNTAYSSADGVLYNNDKTTLVTYPAGKMGNPFTIPNSVTDIGYGAFEDCINLTSVTFQETSKVISIGDYAFYGCTGLTSITIPNSVTSIGKGAFEDCIGLTSITIPDSVTSIGDEAFSGCTNLTSITIPDGVTDIGYGAFSGCTGLTSITIPDGVTSIGDYAFNRCTGLTSITIPNSVTSIGPGAFYGCTGLTSITIGAGVTIGDNLLVHNNNNFRDAYTAAGSSAGTYTADTYNGEWTKIVEPEVVDALALDTLVVAPVKDEAPNTTAIDATQYTGTIAWFESDGTTSVAGNFAASTVYVAKVTLTAKSSGYTLTGVGENSFTYTGATSIANEADSGVVTITFSATEAAPVAVTEISVKTAPDKITYTAGETLDLTGVVVTLTKSDSSSEDVALADFAAKGITTSPENGAVLATTDTKVTITHTASGMSVEQAITVNEAYEITIAQVVGGTATVGTCPANEAAADTLVEVDISYIEAGKQFKSITVKDAGDETVDTNLVEYNSGVYTFSFTMPAKAVTVTVEVEAIPAVP